MNRSPTFSNELNDLPDVGLVVVRLLHVDDAGLVIQYPECVKFDVDGIVAGGKDVEAADIVLVGLLGAVVVVLAVQMVVLLCSIGLNLTFGGYIYFLNALV